MSVATRKDVREELATVFRASAALTAVVPADNIHAERRTRITEFPAINVNVPATRRERPKKGSHEYVVTHEVILEIWHAAPAVEPGSPDEITQEAMAGLVDDVEELVVSVMLIDSTLVFESEVAPIHSEVEISTDGAQLYGKATVRCDVGHRRKYIGTVDDALEELALDFDQINPATVQPPRTPGEPDSVDSWPTPNPGEVDHTALVTVPGPE